MPHWAFKGLAEHLSTPSLFWFYVAQVSYAAKHWSSRMAGVHLAWFCKALGIVPRVLCK